tara:strand:+ start:532 stop:780 length:249 start_codon:yes stop_codon:yes gene_type:complete
MLEKDLINLGFEKVEVRDLEDTFYYYKLEVIDGMFLVSNTDKEAWNNDGEFFISNIDNAFIFIDGFDELAQFISVLRGNTLV